MCAHLFSRTFFLCLISHNVMVRLGDIGSGDGLVFLISGGRTYEMAPKTWGDNEAAGIRWCSDATNLVSTGTGVDIGSVSTTAMLTNAPPLLCARRVHPTWRAVTPIMGSMTGYCLQRMNSTRCVTTPVIRQHQLHRVSPAYKRQSHN